MKASQSVLADTLYVDVNGIVPSLPLDSLIDPPLDSKCTLLVKWSGIDKFNSIDCSNLGTDTLDIKLIKNFFFFRNPDTLYSCKNPLLYSIPSQTFHRHDQ